MNEKNCNDCWFGLNKKCGIHDMDRCFYYIPKDYVLESDCKTCWFYDKCIATNKWKKCEFYLNKQSVLKAKAYLDKPLEA